MHIQCVYICISFPVELEEMAPERKQTKTMSQCNNDQLLFKQQSKVIRI